MKSLGVLPPLPEQVVVRVAGRLGMQFFLNYLRIIRDGRDLLDGLILDAIGQANLGHLDGPGATGRRYLSFDEAAPSDLVRPISANALANSLGLPYETLRRRTVALAGRGECESTKRGLALPLQYYGSHRHRVAAFSICQQVRYLLMALADLNSVRPTPHTSIEADPAPVIGVSRLASEYALRQLEAMGQHIDDPTIGVLLIHIIRLSTDHLDDTATEFSETDDLVRDELRRPVGIALLAARAGVPLETTRRHASQLIERGWVARSPQGGLYLTREMLRSSPWPEARRENVTNLNRLARGLAALNAAPASTEVLKSG